MLGDQDPDIHGAPGWSGHGLDMMRWARSGRQAMLILGILQSPGGPPAAGRGGECVFESGTGHEPAGDTHPCPQALQHTLGPHQSDVRVSLRLGISSHTSNMGYLSPALPENAMLSMLSSRPVTQAVTHSGLPVSHNL